ncbi:crotonase/enoyl-CoA hydratase family protein [Panacagrimonas sp.]|uniref:crotonase/enoyl-CoA hydratase family protein n=1 Tax=Panacagrimonas sp. TaxID=2480088 RepID=UPI003B5242E5
MNRFHDRVDVQVHDDVAHVRLSRPQQHNGMDFDMLAGVIAACRSLRKQRGVRAAILYGEGPSFCAGLDFKTVMAKPAQAAAGYAKLWKPTRNDFQAWSMAWRELPFPVIAAVHGNCFGAGIQLALGADIRIATPDAKLSVMESKWGLIPDMGGAALLRELLPIDVAKELVFSGRIVRGQEAKELGLVTHVDDNPLAAAEKLAAEFATRSPDAVAAGKRLLQQAWHVNESDALGFERLWQRRLMGRANQRIAVRNNMSREAMKNPRPFKPRAV